MEPHPNSTKPVFQHPVDDCYVFVTTSSLLGQPLVKTVHQASRVDSEACGPATKIFKIIQDQDRYSLVEVEQKLINEAKLILHKAELEYRNWLKLTGYNF